MFTLSEASDTDLVQDSKVLNDFLEYLSKVFAIMWLQEVKDKPWVAQVHLIYLWNLNEVKNHSNRYSILASKMNSKCYIRWWFGEVQASVAKLSLPLSFFNGHINMDLDITKWMVTHSKILRDTITCLSKNHFRITRDCSRMGKVVLRPSHFHEALKASIRKYVEELEALCTPLYTLSTVLKWVQCSVTDRIKLTELLFSCADELSKTWLWIQTFSASKW